MNTTCMVLMTGPKSVSHDPTSAWMLIQYIYDHTFSDSMKPPPS